MCPGPSRHTLSQSSQARLSRGGILRSRCTSNRNRRSRRRSPTIRRIGSQHRSRRRTGRRNHDRRSRHNRGRRNHRSRRNLGRP